MVNETANTVNVSISFDRGVFDRLEGLAEDEHRSRSNMAEVLVLEALAIRDAAEAAKGARR